MTSGPNTILKLDARGWYDHIAQVIAAGDTSRFPAVLVQALRRVVPFDYSVFFAYRGQERPICPYDTFTPQQRVVFVSDYLEGPYLLDPFYQVYASRIGPGLYRLREIAPDRFYHSEYYRSYYRRTGLAEEIGFLVSLPHDTLGGGKIFFIGNALVDLFLQSRNWPFGSAVAITLVIIMLITVSLYMRLTMGRTTGRDEALM